MSRATDAGNGSERTKEMTPRESRRHLAQTGRGGTRRTRGCLQAWRIVRAVEGWMPRRSARTGARVWNRLN
jgi:hypothetical protein